MSASCSNYVYREVMRPVRFADDSRALALAYVADRRHRQYAGRLTREERLELVARSRGEAGPNREYVINTVTHLRHLGVCDPELEWMVERLGHDGFCSGATDPTAAAIRESPETAITSSTI